MRQIKQRLVSVAQLTAATQASKMAFPPPSSGSSYPVQFPAGRCHLLLQRHRPGEERSQSLNSCQSHTETRHLISRMVREGHATLLLPHSSRLQVPQCCLVCEIPFPLLHSKLFLFRCSFPNKSLPKAAVKVIHLKLELLFIISLLCRC